LISSAELVPIGYQRVIGQKKEGLPIDFDGFFMVLFR